MGGGAAPYDVGLRFAGALLALAAYPPALAVLACGGNQEPPQATADARPDAGPAAAEVVLEEAYSGIEERRRAVLRSEAEWRALWAEAYEGREPVPEPPTIDFGARMVVVAAMGSKPTGGHSISIEEVRPEGDGIAVRVRETSPGAGCMTTQAFTAPVFAVAVERRPGEATFVEESEAVPCG